MNLFVTLKARKNRLFFIEAFFAFIKMQSVLGQIDTSVFITALNSEAKIFYHGNVVCCLFLT